MEGYPMIINTTVVDNNVTLALTGRLDTVTSSDLSTELSRVFEGEVKTLVFDFTRLDYISSSGLRLLLFSQKKLNATQAQMSIIGCSDAIREIFEMTGFLEIMTIE